MFKTMHKRWFRLLIVVTLCFCIVFSSFVNGYAFAPALAVVPVVAVCSVVLLACGIETNFGESIVSLATQFRDWLQSAQTSNAGLALREISSIASSFTPGSRFRVSPLLSALVRSWIDSKGYQVGSSSLHFPSYSNLSYTSAADGEVLFTTSSYVLSFDSVGSSPLLLFNNVYLQFLSESHYIIYAGTRDHTILNRSSYGVSLVADFSFKFVDGSIRFYFFSTDPDYWINSQYILDNFVFPIITSSSSTIVTGSSYPGASVGVNTGVLPDIEGNKEIVGTIPSTWQTKDIEGGTQVDIPTTIAPSDVIPATGQATGTITGTGEGTGIFEGIGSHILDIPILGDIVGFLERIWSAIVNGFLSVTSAIAQSLATAVDTILNWFNSFSNWLREFIQSIKDFLSNIWESIKDLSSFLKNALKRLGAILEDIWLFLTNIIGTLYNYASNLLSWLLCYNLFVQLLNRFLPNPIASVCIAFFLSSLCIRLFRFILNR